MSKATKAWCAHCRKEDWEEKRKDLEMLSAKLESENKERQWILLTEAKTHFTTHENEQITNFEDIFKSVIEEAKEMAWEFCG